MAGPPVWGGSSFLLLTDSGDFVGVDHEGRQRSIQHRGIDVEGGVRDATDVLEIAAHGAFTAGYTLGREELFQRCDRGCGGGRCGFL